jgi:exonuclease SbcD
MRLLHFSDLHLGVDNYGSIDPTNGLSTRVNDFLRVFDIIVDRAIEERYDAVLFTGDAFKNRDPSPTLQREFARRIVRLAQARIPIVVLVGNHDLPNVVSRATPVEIYQVLEIPGVHVCRSIEKIDVETASGRLQIVALPWITRSLLLSTDMYRNMQDLDFDREMESLISQAVAAEMKQLDPEYPAVLMGHVSLQGAVLGFEQSIMLGKDVTVGLDDLHARSFDYVALGHIHKHQQVGAVPPAVYAGSPERIDFGEEREAKGYVSVAIEPNQGSERHTSWAFVELPARPFRTIRVDGSGDDPMERVHRDITRIRHDVEGAIVRCIVEVDPGRERAVAPLEVRRALIEAGAAHVAHVTVESDTTTRAREHISDEAARDSLKMLERWMEGRKYDSVMRERVLERGRELIEQRRHDGHDG